MKENFYQTLIEMSKCGLSLKEELVLGKEMHQGSEKARETLILGNIQYVEQKANKYAKDSSEQVLNDKISFDDLFSVGIEELIKIIDKYDPNKHVTVRTFMDKSLRGVMLECIENMTGVKCRRKPKTTAERKDDDQQQQTSWNYSDYVEYTQNQFRDYYNNIDYNDCNEDICYNGVEFICDKEDYADYNMVRETKIDNLYKAIESCTNEREREIFEYANGLNGREEMKGKDIAEKFGISEARVSQICKKVMKDLRNCACLREAC